MHNYVRGDEGFREVESGFCAQTIKITMNRTTCITPVLTQADVTTVAPHLCIRDMCSTSPCEMSQVLVSALVGFTNTVNARLQPRNGVGNVAGVDVCSIPGEVVPRAVKEDLHTTVCGDDVCMSACQVCVCVCVCVCVGSESIGIDKRQCTRLAA